MPRFINNLSHIQSRWHQADSEIGAGQEMRREKHLALPILQIVFCVCFCRVFLEKNQEDFWHQLLPRIIDAPTVRKDSRRSRLIDIAN